jgi:DNA adenine methylase
MQTTELLPYGNGATVAPFKAQLLKWIGNKQRFAHEIAGFFPKNHGTYFEPFLGSGAVLGTLAPKNAVASDAFGPLVEIFQTLGSSPQTLKNWYGDRWARISSLGKKAAYEHSLLSYNSNPNGADLLFLCRTCYGGVVRFRARDGHMSTPCGAHEPINPSSFSARVDEWFERIKGTTFKHSDFEQTMSAARPGDLIYCDPPYTHTQTILYGAQAFSLKRLFEVIGKCKARGVLVALSIDGTKRSGNMICDLPIPQGLFEQEAFVNCGRSMLKRFQMDGQTLENEVVTDRLLLTYPCA